MLPAAAGQEIEMMAHGIRHTARYQANGSAMLT